MSSPVLFLMIEMSRTNLHFACVIPPIMAPKDDNRPHLKKVLVCRFYAWGQILAKVEAHDARKSGVDLFSKILCEA